MAKLVNPVIGQVFGDKEFQCIDIFRFKDGNTKCTFLRKQNTGTKENPNWIEKSFYHVVEGLPEGVKSRDIILKTSNIIEIVE